MRIVVQNCVTNEYLTDIGTWSPAVKEAKVFRNSVDAYFHCTRHQVEHSQILLKFGRPELDVKLPVSESCK